MNAISDFTIELFYAWKYKSNPPKAPSCRVLSLDGTSSTEVPLNESAVLDHPSCDHVSLVAVSDTHGKHRHLTVPDGDIFVHCGDILMTGRFYSEANHIKKYKDFDAWMASLPHKHKIVIAGNHDAYLATIGKVKAQQLMPSCHYLEEDTITVMGLRIFGTPRSEGRSGNRAFQSHTALSFDDVPTDIDILLCHQTIPTTNKSLEKYLMSTRARFVCTGHLHMRAGVYPVRNSARTVLINASSMGSHYAVCHPPIVFYTMKRIA